jgi:hypothetical protein
MLGDNTDTQKPRFRLMPVRLFVINFQHTQAFYDPFEYFFHKKKKIACKGNDTNLRLNLNKAFSNTPDLGTALIEHLDAFMEATHFARFAGKELNGWINGSTVVDYVIAKQPYPTPKELPVDAAMTVFNMLTEAKRRSVMLQNGIRDYLFLPADKSTQHILMVQAKQTIRDQMELVRGYVSNKVTPKNTDQHSKDELCSLLYDEDVTLYIYRYSNRTIHIVKRGYIISAMFWHPNDSQDIQHSSRLQELSHLCSGLKRLKRGRKNKILDVGDEIDPMNLLQLLGNLYGFMKSTNALASSVLSISY